MVGNMCVHESVHVFAARVVFREGFVDESAHVRLLAALFVIVACSEGRLAEACDGEILFFGIFGERDGILLVPCEGCHSELDGFEGLV